MTAFGVTASPIELGMALFTMVEPHKGHEVAYNRWYERDHFYAGCQIGTYNLGGRRFVATRDLKALRYPDPSPIVPDQQTGSYLALYYVLKGHTDEWNEWAVDQVNVLHANGRMFTDRDHIHTLLYDYDFAVARDADGVPPELALDHPYKGLVAVIADAADEAAVARVRDDVVPALIKGSAAGQVLHFSPHPLKADAPADVVRVDQVSGRFLHLYFLDEAPDTVWEQTFAGLGAAYEKAGATVAFVSPFIPTIPGTDTYTDQLW
ncbi:MAG TPA: hypothetical protein VHE83_01010 [Mycobacteriales bacterium]|nr:hypothetical protein [Mycobacteriales bacterium]